MSLPKTALALEGALTFVLVVSPSHQVSAVAPLAVEYFPAPQSVHVVCAVVGLYMPAGQLKQLAEVSM